MTTKPNHPHRAISDLAPGNPLMSVKACENDLFGVDLKEGLDVDLQQPCNHRCKIYLAFPGRRERDVSPGRSAGNPLSSLIFMDKTAIGLDIPDKDMLFPHAEQLRHILLPEDVALSKGRALHPAGDNLSYIMTEHHPYGALDRDHLHKVLLPHFPKVLKNLTLAAAAPYCISTTRPFITFLIPNFITSSWSFCK